MAQSTYSTNEERTPVKNATTARQGMRGRHIMWVLAISFILAAAAMFLSWAFQSRDLTSIEQSNPGLAPRAEANRVDVGDPAVKQNDLPGQPSGANR